MIKTAGELITRAQKEIDCVNPVEAKALYNNSNDAVIVDVREAKNYDESSLNNSINIPRGLIEMLIEKKADGIISVTQTNHPIEFTNVLPEDLSLDNFLDQILFFQLSVQLHFSIYSH